jgi:hypothetical protein
MPFVMFILSDEETVPVAGWPILASCFFDVRIGKWPCLPPSRHDNQDYASQIRG